MCVTPKIDSRLPIKAKKYLSKSLVDARVANGESLVIINNKIYNLSKWLPLHPGGELAIKHMVGKDATDAFSVLHPPWAMKKIHPFYIADLEIIDIKMTQMSEDFIALDKRLRDDGLYSPKPLFWVGENLKFFALFIGTIYFTVYAWNNYCYIASAFLLSQLWHQAAFVAHDAGHSSITHNRKLDTIYGTVLANFFGGLSIGWWKHSHYVHHIITNDPEHDPDIQHMPFFAITTKLTKNLYSSFHGRVMIFDKFAQFFVTRQHKLYYVVLAFGRFNLYAQSWVHVLTHPQVFNRTFEISCMVGFWIWFTYFLSYLPTKMHVVGFIIVSHVITMFLHLQITLSHFGMSTDEVADESWSEKALRTTMDVDCPEWLDWFHGGLQFQVEHHLFPRIPRHNLRRVQPFVKRFAKDHGLDFHSYTFVKANRYVLGVLEDVANQIGAVVNADISHVR